MTRQKNRIKNGAAERSESATDRGSVAAKMRTDIEGASIRVRAYRADDVDAVHEAICESISELCLWMPWCHPDYRREETEAWVGSRPEAWQKADEYSFVIEDRRTGELLGGCGLNQIKMIDLRANLGYWVRTARTGRGIATEATRALATAAFEDLDLQRIEIAAAIGNRASQRVAEKAGATREGVARRSHRVRGEQCDMVIFSFIRKDFGLGSAGGKDNS